jgi:hypothetical protein
MGGWECLAGRDPISKPSDLASLYRERCSVRETSALGEMPQLSGTREDSRETGRRHGGADRSAAGRCKYASAMVKDVGLWLAQER